ncbi:hypothetical protein [Streptomyces sp. S.PNR 29]|uniref:hypothetical protein n=1 Tax=Streptomyces sp. S.PNR 29 TaxID=2973805 RepID=UPI0025AFEAC9|nr:hypothetical protein [Streptomyces sp. S.PNR 29]MDN0193691.1 hypothetical protein [Streptomyces sp. S.PNR 29]
MGLFDKLAGTRYPDPGVVPLPAADVRAALLVLDGPEVPYRIRNALPAEKADLVAEWQVRELRTRLRTRMRLVPEHHEVRVLEERWDLSPDRSRRYGRGPTPTVSRQWTYERGPDGRRRRVETFRFDSREMSHSLRNAVLDSGWTWRGVLFRW